MHFCIAMKTFLAALIMSLSLGLEQPQDSLLVMFWNLENFFDWKVDSTSTSTSDKEFSSFGSRHWTKKKFQAKCNAISKTIFWTADQEGRLPDVIGLAEIENRFVLRRLLSDTQLERLDYSIIHYDSPDPRGIDVALLYRKSSLELVSSHPVKVGGGSGSFKTRDILIAVFKTTAGSEAAFLVNHHPSKYGSDSGWKREEAIRCLKSSMDSLKSRGILNMVAMGDFNDTPDASSFRTMTEGEYVNLAEPLARKGQGTIKYNGKWDLIDMFIIPGEMPSRNGMKVLHVPFLTVRDSAHSGEKPLRTYSGPRYLGGVSDHCPIAMFLVVD